MGALSKDETIIWQQFQKGKNTSTIAQQHPTQQWSPAYTSRVLNRAREKIAKTLQEHANSHRLDIETLLDYKGLLIGFDYQTSSQVYIVYTEKLGVIIWYKHDSYAGKQCPKCPKENECRETLNAVIEEYNLTLRPDEKQLPMTQQANAVFNKLAAKEIPRYKRRGGD
ncbi:MAG: hypothetical protein NWE93_01255 [Candidatus Bathyarchaeota archaeon]|nr:hypothetical protein [Candidatus Bathyarchaeota archaeon]